MQLTLNVEGEKKLAFKLNFIAKKVANMKEAFKDVGKYIVKDIQENMEASNKRRSFGGAWAPLSASTLKARANRTGYYRQSGGGTKPLIWTGRLKKGFKIEKVDKFLIQVGNPVKYFPFHQFGGSPSPPKRQMMGWHKNMIGDIIQIFNIYINKAITK